MAKFSAGICKINIALFLLASCEVSHLTAKQDRVCLTLNNLKLDVFLSPFVVV